MTRYVPQLRGLGAAFFALPLLAASLAVARHCFGEPAADALMLAQRAAEKVPAERAQSAYARLAIAQADSGRLEEARKSMAAALSHQAERLPNGIVSEFPAGQTSLALALTGRVDEALELAASITKRFPRAAAIASIAATLKGPDASTRRSDLFQKAVALAGSGIGSRESGARVAALIQVAYVQHGAGFAREAGATLTHAAAVIEAGPDRSRRADGLARMAAVQFQIGDKAAASDSFAKALEAAGETADDFVRANLVDAAIAVGQLDQAAELVRSMRGVTARLIAQSRVGSAMARVGRRKLAVTLFDEALATYSRLPAGERQTQDLSFLTTFAQDSGRGAAVLPLLEEALTRARLSPSPPLRRTDALSALGRAYCVLGRHDKAVTVLEEAIKAEAVIDWSKVEGFRADPDSRGILIHCLVGQRQMAAAIDRVSNIKDRDKRSMAFFQLANTLARIDPVRALACAGRVDDPEWRLNAYLEIAGARLRK